jgi:hypothetical protein
MPISFRCRKVTQTASGPRPVGPYLTHSGVECHPNYFQDGRIDYFSFRRQRSPRPLLGRWGSVYLILAWKATQTTFGPVGQKKKQKKDMAPYGIRTHTSLNAQRFTTLTFQTCDVTPLKVYWPNKKLYRFSSAPEAVFGMLPNLTNRSFFYEKNVWMFTW